MRVRLAQINPCVGDLKGNLSIISQQILLAFQSKCDVVVFPELATVGYPPRDLLYSRILWDNHPVVIERILKLLRSHPHQLTVIVGGLHEQLLSGGRYARYNAAWILDRHYGKRVVHKRLLPCYDVFDETRYFTAETGPYAPIPIRIANKGDILCDVLICEDIWNNGFQDHDWLKPHTYATDPVERLAGLGPLFVLNGSPFWIGKIGETRKLVEAVCARIGQPVFWCNQVGAHDDLVTGGYSMVAIPLGDRITLAGERVAFWIAKPFQEDALEVNCSDKSGAIFKPHGQWNATLTEPVFFTLKDGGSIQIAEEDFDMWTLYKALYLHMFDYKRRCGFTEAVLGLSGGIDSAVTAVIAVDVFGAENVIGVGLPSQWSSAGSVDDAEALADNLGIRFEVKRIAEIYDATKALFLSGGKQKFSNPITDENIQPRVRGMILMVYSNDAERCLLLTTGNKSEISVGYCTLYGDMCGGIAVLSDVWKTEVYDLAYFYNKYRGEIIPENTITKPPSPELKLDQQDTDTLPPYNKLDPLLRMLVEEEMTPEEILDKWKASLLDPAGGVLDVETGHIVHRIYKMYRNSEFKRQQMPIGPKVQERSFGSGRRMPIAMKLTTVKNV